HGVGRVPVVVVVVVQRQVGDRDAGERHRVVAGRRVALALEGDQAVEHLAVDRLGGGAADDAADVDGHGGSSAGPGAGFWGSLRANVRVLRTGRDGWRVPAAF